MKPEFKIMGSWTAGHLTYNHDSVMNYAGGFTSNGQYQPIPKIDCTAASATTTTTSTGTDSTSTTTTGTTTDSTGTTSGTTGTTTSTVDAYA